MSQMLGGFWTGEDFEWKSGAIYDLQDGFVVQFFIPTDRVFNNADDARDFAAHFARGLSWCVPSPGLAWHFDFDDLRRHLRIPLPEWLRGSASTCADPQPTTLTPPKPGEPVVLDALQVTCRFSLRGPEPTLDAILDAANRPIEIRDSLSRFKQDFPYPERTAFVMMRFGHTPLHRLIYETIQATLRGSGLTALRADEKEYHPNLFENAMTYLHGCRFGIAVFERLTGDDFNPNVSLEVGYLLGLRKPVCLLKDQTLRGLHTDLVGRIYRPFDPQSPETSIPVQLQSWMREKGLLAAQ